MLVAEKLHIKVRKEDVTAVVWTSRVAWATLIGGVLFIALERWLRDRSGRVEISWAVALAVWRLGRIEQKWEAHTVTVGDRD